MPKFKLISEFKPTGDQPQAIDKLVAGINLGLPHQVLLGVTGSGKSVVKNTSTIVKYPNGKIVNRNIGELIDEIFTKFKSKIKIINGSELIFLKDLPREFRFNTYSFDPVSKGQYWKPVTQLVRHNSPDTLYKVTTICGREIIVTGDHNFFVLRNGKLTLSDTATLSTNDFFPIPLSIPEPSLPLRSISLVQYLLPERKLYVSVPNFRTTWDSERDILRAALTPQQVHSLLVGGERVAYPLYQQLILLTSQLSDGAKIGLRSRKYQYDFEYTINENFMKLVGYYIAEGHAENNYFIITSGDVEVVNDFKISLKDLGLQTSLRPCTYDYVIRSALWSEILQKWCGRDSKTKRLPLFWMQLSNFHLAALLRAYFSADGGVEGVGVSCTTVSSQLASDIVYALLRFGIVARIRKRKMKIPNSERKGEYYVIKISGKKDLQTFALYINFTLRRKQEKLVSIIKDNPNTNVDLIPIDGGWLKKVRLVLGLSQKKLADLSTCSRALISLVENNHRLPSRDMFEKIILNLERFSFKISKLNLLSEIKEKRSLLNLFWSSVKSIKTVEGEEYVYDFAVEEYENFLVGNGGVFVHNTFTVANVIEKVQKPTLVISHNKTLAGQLAQEFKFLFPDNAVEYFVSYYDYYQPEAYIPQSDTYIEKETEINEEIEKLRLSATASLMTRKDVIVVASVSAIYNLGSPVEYGQAILEIKKGMVVSLSQVLKILVKMYYTRNDLDFHHGTYRVKGDTVDIFPSYKDEALRIEFLEDKVERVSIMDPLTAKLIPLEETQVIYPAKHYITPQQRLIPALAQIEHDLEVRLKDFKKTGKLLEAQRLEQRTYYDLEMIKEFGYCNGIENYSRYFDGREEGAAPYTLLDYFPKDFLLVIDESHMTIPQIRGMYNGDRSRKGTLIDFGFRLPSALDNRPLKFTEFMQRINQVIYTSATPHEYELSLPGKAGIVEQLIRPTGILDPEIIIKPTKGQVEDLIKEIGLRIKNQERVLITTLTKRMAEDLSEYLKEKGVKVHYLHSDVETLKRSDILHSLRLGEYDVIVGINLLREGLDLPEVSLVAILDADKEGFLRSRTSLIQTMGRAARHINGKVFLYADKVTGSMKMAIEEVERRRNVQEEYNLKHEIIPKGIIKGFRNRLIKKIEEGKEENVLKVEDIPLSERNRIIKELETQMKQAAAILDFETAAKLRDQIKELKN